MVKVSLDEALTIPYQPSGDLVALDDALTALAAVDPRKAKVIELRYFGGLSVKETADILSVSPSTVIPARSFWTGSWPRRGYGGK